MAATLGDLVTEVRYLMRSFTGQHDRTTYLTGDINLSATSANVNDGSVVARGLVEIEDELLWVQSVAANVLTVAPFGRGYQGSTAAAHTSGTQVIVDPVFTKQAIKQALAETAQAVYPELFQVKSKEFSFSPAKTSYDLAADADRILSVSYKVVGPSGYWQPMRKYQLDTNANTTSFASGRALHLMEPAAAGQTVRVLYAAPFTEMTLSTDTLSAAGFAESHRDVLVHGAAARLVQYLEPSRLTMNAVENQERGKYTANGAASALARQLLGWYQQRLADERKKLLDRYPVTRSLRSW